ncbi:MAG: Unknown protein [uncultured Sulfurovum sp.]|uniref:Uncharacterized protein n=1 Tax=uncultured Sulfurovum sp. TaxID=269237 RepID=A0A6S6TN29_9BACT|nr:MAG: Unknown protein [uncultured Sulfurovum sp.]
MKNKGRNVINIAQVEQSIVLYAKEKKVSIEVSSWLEKNFLRWLINHFPYVQVVQSEERYNSLLRGAIPSFKLKSVDVEFRLPHHTLLSVLKPSLGKRVLNFFKEVQALYNNILLDYFHFYKNISRLSCHFDNVSIT